MKMSPENKGFWVFFSAQTGLYCVMCVNMRAVAQADYVWSLVSDLAIASMNFLVIRRIAAEGSNGHKGMLGYVLGSLTGTSLGIWISTQISR